MDNRTPIDAGKHPLSAIVLRYSDIHEEIVKRAKQPGHSIAAWDELAELVDVDTFQRVGTFKEVLNWKQYTQMLDDYAGAASWEGTLRHITELPGVVFLELEERVERPTGERDVVNTCSVFRFNADNKLCNLYIYMQSPALALSTAEADKGFRPIQDAGAG